MKYVIFLPDGAADEPLAELAGRTPLAAARIPHMDSVAMSGRLGLVRTVPNGFIPGTDVATLSLFGYDPHKYYTGRAPLEAAAQGLTVGPRDIIFRCNFVTVTDGRMADFTAGHIPQAETDALIAALNELFADEPFRFRAGVSYRNLMIAEGFGDRELRCQPPHDIPNQPVADHRPVGDGAAIIEAVMAKAGEMIAGHEVNRARKAEGRAPVTGIWLWGQGRPTQVPTLRERFGLSGATITGVDIIRGIAVCMGMELIEVEGATGYIDTNYRGKGEAAAAALDTHDLVVVHVEAPDEAGHLGDAREKVLALERFDELVVGPVLEKLRGFDEWRAMVAPDHPTPVGTKAHSATPPPVCFAGTGVDAVERREFDEANAKAGGWFVEHGHELFGQFIGNRQP